jgi:7,8-dihydro-6-hydroxymethylpterin-pyrophosphokinase
VTYPLLGGVRKSAGGDQERAVLQFCGVGATDLPLMELDRRLKFIEADNGRYAPDRKGLPLDIDVLLYGDLVGNFDGLILPRAEILKNAFVSVAAVADCAGSFASRCR